MIRSAVALAALAATAHAEPLDLTVHRAPSPTPTGLSMRADPPAPTAAAAPATAPASAPDRNLLFDLPGRIASLGDKVTFRFDLGLGLDGGQPTGDPLTSGHELGPEYRDLRVYTFGDAVLGSRGVLLPSLTTYFAAQFRFDQNGAPVSSALPSVYDSPRNDSLLIRSGYVELADAFDNRWLRPVFVKAGRQFRYGAAIAHFDGVALGYDTDAVAAGAFVGQRVELHGLYDDGALAGEDRVIAGLDAKLNMFPIRRIPLAVFGEFLTYGGVDNLAVGGSLRLGEGSLMRARIRSRDGRLARETVTLRSRLSEVTTLQIVVDNRHADDWAYDLLASEPSYGGDDPRRFLALGVPLPRTRVAVRAGTVLFDNLDVLARGAVALDTSDLWEPSATAPGYAELGAAVEGRVRRSLRLGTSVLFRRYRRHDVDPTTTRTIGAPDPLPASTGALGERSFWQGDVTARYVLGARKFSASGELYGRWYRDPTPFAIVDEMMRPIDVSDVRLGGRFGLEAWLGDKLRLRGEYDTAFAPEFVAPEIRGQKSLRVVAEGSF